MLLTLLYLSLVSVVVAQPPQEIHPWQTECGNYGCFINWFCAPSTDLCGKCPKEGGTTEDDCRNSMILLSDTDTDSTVDTNEATTYYTNETDFQIDLDSCIEECVKPQVGDLCTDNGCDPGRFFCNYQDDLDIAVDGIEVEEEGDNSTPTKKGTCTPCKEDIRDCLNDPIITSSYGVEECILCDIGVCVPLHFSVTTEVNTDEGEDVIIDSTALQGSPMMVEEGEIVSCNNLVYREENTCVPGGNDLPTDETRQEGKICLVHDYTKNSYFISVVNKCANLGGVGVVMFQENLSRVPNNETWTGSLSYLPTTIPSVVIPYDDGIRWEKERIGKIVKLNVTDIGDACIQQQFCSDDIPCVGSSEGMYCDYKWGGGNGGNGFCRDCPTDEDGNPEPLQCFFNLDEDRGKIMGQSGVESCAETCAFSLKFPSCKFCPEDVSGFDFGLKNEGDENCRFCPENDVLYPDKEFPLFGEGITCWMVQKFFDSVDVNTNAKNCELAQMMNYVCGCSGEGYLGADSLAKQKTLAWLPRVSAILSILGSMFIIYDTTKSQAKRKKVMNQLLCGLSIFDILGAWGYVFTTLPIPEFHEYGPIWGAKGNEATCTAQGFFIQLGTISAYMNVSLAVYYYLVIKLGYEERRLKKIRWPLFLFPILVGLAFAFAGIPFYDSLNLWCNNTASYWPDIPVAIAIGLATIIMALVCWDVYSKEKASAKWRPGGGGGGTGGRQTLSSQVFWQSFFYLFAFYLTWPPYLALQYAWAGGSALTNYGLVLTAATLVPLQGFWNMLVYIRPRHWKKAKNALSSRRSKTAPITTQSSFLRQSWKYLGWTKRSKPSNVDVGSNEIQAEIGVGSSDKNKKESNELLESTKQHSGDNNKEDNIVNEKKGEEKEEDVEEEEKQEE